MWELVTAKQPHAGLPLAEVMQRVLNDDVHLQFPDACLEEYSGLAARCMQRAAEGRPAFTEIVVSGVWGYALKTTTHGGEG